MEKSSLVEQISTPIGKKAVLLLAKQYISKADEVLELCLHHNYETAFRAAWILEGIAEINPNGFTQHLGEFINTYLRLTNHSVQRHFTKILMSLTQFTGGADIFWGDKVEAIIETTFEWLIDPQTPVAVRVNCMDILYNLKGKNDWIADELRAQIEFQLQNGSAALQSRGRRILARLSRKK